MVMPPLDGALVPHHHGLDKKELVPTKVLPRVSKQVFGLDVSPPFRLPSIAGIALMGNDSKLGGRFINALAAGAESSWPASDAANKAKTEKCILVKRARLAFHG